MTPILVICILCVFAHFAKGVTGAASAIVFNAGLLTALALGLSGGLTLLDGLYWIALADLFASAMLGVLLWRQLKVEKLALLLLCGLVPITVVFTLLLPHLDLGGLSLVLALAVVGGGVYLAFRPDGKSASASAINRWALPTGLGAGVLNGLFGMGGPVIFILLSRASDDPGMFRRRTVFINIAAGLARVVTLAACGVFERKHFEWFGWAVPVMAAALLLGMWAHTKVKPRPFRVALGLLVMLAGIGGLLRFALG
ncbi:MAG: sulfite exporter TauE/SafE family protein [Planctomycetes bacterium]|nr:sulfite exporter TauE/SafE family protein [Planctomycetota bacterium]